ncbi:hypothetical protein CH371_04210 [Leptospira wolffii]|uniref:Uncharacterized protein n=1 Tax=Leptospira wolffii TaxID=409998 RepID=A0A2M9ZFU8_9LEPT|nr:hypothetical protein CH371_04210 [Leptospira wolffii]
MIVLIYFASDEKLNEFRSRLSVPNQYLFPGRSLKFLAQIRKTENSFRYAFPYFYLIYPILLRLRVHGKL